jgi:hypothetical protein
VCQYDAGGVEVAILLAGTGRSGTTWLAEMLNSENAFRYLFEPFHAQKIPLCSELPYRPYVVPGARDEELERIALQILSGRVRHPWIDAYNGRRFSHRRLIKEIRINQLLGWVASRWPAMPIVFLLRHPFAVAVSKLALGWETHLDIFLSNPALVENHLAPFVDEIGRAKTPFERHIFMWCIETYVPLRELRPDDALVLFYEDLCTRPEPGLKQLCDHIRYAPSHALGVSADRPSAQSRKDSAVVQGGDRLSSWKKSLSDSDIRRGLEILSLFGLDRMYNEDPLPRENALERFRDQFCSTPGVEGVGNAQEEQ